MIRAGIIFDNYIVNEASFKKNINFNHKGTINLNTDFQCHIHIQGTSATVQLECSLGEMMNEAAPFEVKVSLVGNFEFNESESENVSFEEYLSTNAIAILFPYIRSLIANLTARSNEFPVLNLPVINIVKMVQDKDLINVTYND